MKLPPQAKRQLADAAKAAGNKPVFVVGGCVRDWLLNRPTKDVDLVVVGDPEAVVRALAKKWRARAERFDEFGTWRLFGRDGRVDLARARAETYAEPAALPVVRPADSIEDDLRRRDFTVNSMALPAGAPFESSVIDIVGGLSDLEARLLRVLHPASFQDDPTRVFRAARFAARFKLKLEPDTHRWLVEAVAGGMPKRLSRERVRNELMRILDEKDPAPALAKLVEWRVAPVVSPTLAWAPAVSKPASAAARLGIVAVATGPDAKGARAFLDSLNLDREISVALRDALDCWFRKQAPRTPLQEAAADALRLLGVPSHARQPLIIDGEDLKAAGVPEGPKMGKLLEEAAKAQWEGKFTTRKAALAWLKAQA